MDRLLPAGGLGADDQAASLRRALQFFAALPGQSDGVEAYLVRHAFDQAADRAVGGIVDQPFGGFGFEMIDEKPHGQRHRDQLGGDDVLDAVVDRHGRLRFGKKILRPDALRHGRDPLADRKAPDGAADFVDDSETFRSRNQGQGRAAAVSPGHRHQIVPVNGRQAHPYPNLARAGFGDGAILDGQDVRGCSKFPGQDAFQIEHR